MDFEAHLSTLAELETFDPVVFKGDGSVPQSVCDFVLALSLVFNDLKDLLDIHLVLNDPKPSGLRPYTKQFGAINGIDHHIFRLVGGILHELTRLIKNSHEVTDHLFFQRLVNKLPVTAREDWATLSAVAQGEQKPGLLGKSLAIIRNKVIFHYDPGVIGKGCIHHFANAEEPGRRAFVSRGINMATSRFYFADAASTGTLPTILGPEAADSLPGALVEITGRVNTALHALVLGFVSERGGAFRGNYDVA